jgi:hypothetical protein
VILHEITSHRIEQFKRDRLNGTWRAFKQKTAANPVKPATVSRELDTLRSILSKTGRHTVMSISGHSSTRMLERYTHPTLERRIVALETFDLSTKCPQKSGGDAVQQKEAAEAASFLSNLGLPAVALDADRWRPAFAKATAGNLRTTSERRLVDGRRLELPTSALRTRRSPN